MRRRSHYLDLDKVNLRRNTPYGAQVHPAGLDLAPSFSTLARAKTNGDLLDLCSPRSLSPADPTSPLSSGLREFSTAGQMEGISSNVKASHYRQLSGCPRLATTLRWPLFRLPPPLCGVFNSPPVTYGLCSMNTLACACYTALCCDTVIIV